MTTAILKVDVVDDLDPNAAAPAADRIFPVSLYSLNGMTADRSIFKARAVKGTVAETAASATSATYTGSLWLYNGTVWIQAGYSLDAINSNRLVNALLPSNNPSSIGSSAVVDGFLQMTNIVVSGDAVGFVQTIYESDYTDDTPRNRRGFPEVAIPPVTTWSVVGAIVAPDGIAPRASVTGGDAVYPERMGLLQADLANGANIIEILDATGAIGAGIQLAGGDSVEMPVENLRYVYCHGSAPGLILRVSKF